MHWRSDAVENFSELPYSPQKSKEEAKGRAEAQERLNTAVGPLVPEEREEKPSTKPLLDAIRDYGSGFTHAQRERQEREEYEARRAGLVQATANQKPTTADIAAAEAEVARINAWLQSDEGDDDAELPVEDDNWRGIYT